MRRYRRLAALFAWFLVVGHTAAQAHADARPTVAVLYFDYSGRDEQLSVLRKGLTQMLISDLGAVERVRLVERDRLEEVLAELKLAQSGKIDAKTAAQVGKLLGARYLVLGGYFDLMETLRADARVVEVETGKVVRSIGAQGKPQDFLGVEQKLSEGLSAILGDAGAVSAPAVPEGPKPAAPRPRIAPPQQLKTKTALAYSRALDAIDRKDKAGAKKTLEDVVKEQPDFRLARLDLDRLMQ